MKFAEPRSRAQFSFVVLLQVIVLLAATISLPGAVIAQDGDTATDPAPATESATPTPAPDPFVAPPTKQEAAKQATGKQTTTKQSAKQTTTKQPAKKTTTDQAKQAEATPQAADHTLRLYPKNARLALTENTLVGAWSCPANDKTPFGKDKEPGTADDDCTPVKARWSLGHAAAAHLTQAVGAKTRVILDSPVRTKLIARWNGQKRTVRVTPQDLPLATQTQEATPAPAKLAPFVALGEEATAEPTAEPTEQPATEPTTEPPAEPTSEQAIAEPSTVPAEQPTAEPSTVPTAEPPASSGVTQQRVILPAALQITVKDHEGQKPDASWTSGNVSGYTEGDTINFRFSVTATAVGSGTFEIRYTANNGCDFFIQSFGLGNVGISTAPPVSPTGSNISLTLGSNTLVGGTWVQVVNVAATGVATVTGSYHLTIATNASTCTSNGATGITGETGGVQVSGRQNVPVSGTFKPIPTGSITIIKDAQPEGDQSFAFGATGSGVSGFSLVDDGTVANTKTFSDLTPGNYSVMETVPIGWHLSGLVCTGGGTNTSTSVESATATIGLDQDETVVCTFTNTRASGSLELKKALDPSDDPGLFDLTIAGVATATDVGDGGSTGPQTVPTGSYDLSEAAGSGTDLADYGTTFACTGNATAATGSGTAWSVEVAEDETVVCTFTNTRASGSLELKKALDPSDDPGLFDLTIAGVATATDVGDGGSTGPQTVPTGSYDLSEAAGSGTDLADYGTTFACTGNATAATGSGTAWSVEVAEDETVVCTFTNTRASGSLELKKALDPSDDPGLFDLTIAGVATATDVGDGGSTGPQTVPTGSYDLSEAAGSGTDLADYGTTFACTGNATAATGSGTAWSVEVAEDETVVCTFTNTRASGSLELKKALDPSDDPGLFDLTIAGVATATDVGDGGSTGPQTVPTGSYDLSEAAGSGTDLADYGTTFACTGNATAATGSGTAWSVEVAEDETVVCTFTNTRASGSVTIKKVTDPSPDPTGTSFTFSGDVSGSIGDGGTIVLPDLAPGTYTSTELVPGGWTLDSIVCDDDDSSGDTGTATATVVVGAGEDVTCTFTNVAGDVAITVSKSASKATISDQGEQVTFTYDVTNTGATDVAITSLEDDVFGTLAGDADCGVGTVLGAGVSCTFEATFLVTPSVTPDPTDPEQVIPDHVNTFEACSILSSTSPTAPPDAVRLAAVTDCATATATVSFGRTFVEDAGETPQPKPSTPPTDMLPATDAGSDAGGSPQPVWPWIVFTLLGAAIIVGGGVVLRRSRKHTP